MLMLDVTGSFNWPAAFGSTVLRKSVVSEALRIVTSVLAQADSQAATEAEAGEEFSGGLMTVTFADGHAQKIGVGCRLHDSSGNMHTITEAEAGDLNPTTFTAYWNSITFAGGTRIMPGFRKVQQVYTEEFGTLPPTERPKLLLLVITDGEADDTESFAQALSAVSGGTYVEVAIVGYGEEHDRALAAYQAVAESNAHVKVTSFDSTTDPQALADGLLRMIA